MIEKSILVARILTLCTMALGGAFAISASYNSTHANNEHPASHHENLSDPRLKISSGYTIDRYSVESGVQTSGDASWTIRGTAGQAEAATSSGGSFQMRGGFQPKIKPILFHDGFENGAFSEWSKAVSD